MPNTEQARVGKSTPDRPALTACGPTQIRGTVATAGGGQPIANLRVTAYSNSTEQEVGSTTTNAQGAYELSGLPGASYRVRAGNQWSGGGTSWATATAVDVTGFDLDGFEPPVVDFVLADGFGAIDGSVLRNGRPMSSWSVEAMAGPTFEAPAGTVRVQPDGTFEIGRLGAGTYKLRVRDQYSTIHAWWQTPGKTDADRADSPAITVAADATAAAGTFEHLFSPCQPGVSFDGIDFRGMDLHGVDLTGCDLSGLDFSGANLQSINASDATFDDADLAGADLTGATLAGASFARTSFGMDATLAKLDGADFRGAAFREVTVEYMPFSGVDFTGADLRGSTLKSGRWHNAKLDGANLDGTNMSFGDYDTVSFTGASMNGTSLGTDFDLVLPDWSRGIRSGGITGTPSSLPRDVALRGGYLVGVRTDLRDADLRNLDLTGLNLKGANLDGADLRGADMTGSGGVDIIGTPAHLPAGWILPEQKLVGPYAYLGPWTVDGLSIPAIIIAGMDLTGADLRGLVPTRGPFSIWPSVASTNFTNTNLTGVTFSEGTNMTGAIFTGANMTDVSMEEDDLTWVKSGGVTGSLKPSPNATIGGGYLIGRGADVQYVDFTGADLTGAPMAQAHVDGIHGTGITGQPASMPGGMAVMAGRIVRSSEDLTGIDARGSRLFGDPTVRDWNLTSANLTGFTGTGQAFHSCQFVGANLTDSNFAGALALGLDFSEATLTNADLAGARFVGSTFVGADLTGADLTGATIQNTDLSGATITGADFTGVTFDTVTATGLIGTPAALPAGWTIVGGTLTPTP